jgi:hypothetical protein
MPYGAVSVAKILSLWKESGLHEALGENPNALSVRIYRLYTAEDLKHAFKCTKQKLDEGSIEKRDGTLLESACRYATGIAKRCNGELKTIQAEIDLAEATPKVGEFHEYEPI